MDNNRNSWGYTRGHTRLKSGKGSSFSMFPSFLLRPCQISLKERYQWLQSTRWFELDRQMTEPQTVLSWKGITRFIKSSSWPSQDQPRESQHVPKVQMHKWQSYSTLTVSPSSKPTLKQEALMLLKLLGSPDTYFRGWAPLRCKGSVLSLVYEGWKGNNPNTYLWMGTRQSFRTNHKIMQKELF